MANVLDNYRRRLLGINRAVQHDLNLTSLDVHMQNLVDIENHLGMLDEREELMVLLETVKTSVIAGRRNFQMRSEIQSRSFQPGTKRLVINKERLEYLLQQGFSVVSIAERSLLGRKVHRNTINNAIKKFGIRRKKFSTLGDEEMKEHMMKYKESFPNSGALEMQAHLRSDGIIIQRDRCRRLMRIIDPDGVASRWAQTISRRQYQVPTPNSLWHIDTNHKLIRFYYDFY